jgi:hypothetical protein
MDAIVQQPDDIRSIFEHRRVRFLFSFVFYLSRNLITSRVSSASSYVFVTGRLTHFTLSFFGTTGLERHFSNGTFRLRYDIIHSLSMVIYVSVRARMCVYMGHSYTLRAAHLLSRLLIYQEPDLNSECLGLEAGLASG